MTILESLARALRGETVIALRVEVAGLRKGEPVSHRVAGRDKEALLREVAAYEDADDPAWQGFRNGPVPGFEGQPAVIVTAWTATSVIRSFDKDDLWTWRSLPLKPESADMATAPLVQAIDSCLDGIDPSSLPARVE